jgi:hypothetical protein
MRDAMVGAQQVEISCQAAHSVAASGGRIRRPLAGRRCQGWQTPLPGFLVANIRFD